MEPKYCYNCGQLMDPANKIIWIGKRFLKKFKPTGFAFNSDGILKITDGSLDEVEKEDDHRDYGLFFKDYEEADQKEVEDFVKECI